jgi:hypothetical protein
VVVEVMDQLARQFLAKRGGPKAVLRRWPKVVLPTLVTIPMAVGF